MNGLTNAQQVVINQLSQSPLKEKFYWTGGTLLSVHYLHHRRSEDLDFFTDEEFSFHEVNDFVQSLKNELQLKEVTSKRIFDHWEFLLKNEERLRIEFVYYDHQYQTLDKRNSFLGITIDSLKDLAANKTLALFDRNEPKDAFDIYFLINKAHFSPLDLLKLAHQKFGVKFDETSFWSEALKASKKLNSLKPLLEIPAEDKQRLLKKIKSFFENKAQNYLHQTLAHK